MRKRYIDRPEILNASAAASRRIGCRLRELRLQRGLSVADMVAKVGTHYPIVYRIENGDRTPSLETLIIYAQALDVSLLDILSCLDGLPLEAA